MVLAQVATGGAYALSLAVIVAVVYLAVVRFMDLNEKEPLWAVGSVFLLGAIAAAILPLLVNSVVLELNTLWGAAAEELAKFVAFFLSVVALGAVARSRGWPEISGLTDGIVYGTAMGFGYATGEAFVRELAFGGVFSGAAIGAGPLTTLWTTALTGLSDGLFGAIIGVGFGAAVNARSGLQRAGYPIAGLIGAILAHAAFTFLAQGNALGGSAGLVRTWIALVIPILFVFAVMAAALVRERQTIGRELAEERETGAVTDEELDTLKSFAARRSRYIKAFTSGDFDGWLAMRELHNRQVQLALAKHRARHNPDPESQAEIQSEVEQLRASVLWMKRSPEIAGLSQRSGEAGT